jgi:transposase
VVWYPRQLTPAQLEERRLRGARLLRAGRFSQAQIARELGVSRAAVCQWAGRLAAGEISEGSAARLESLGRRPHTGRRPRLTEAEWDEVGALLRRGARASGFDTERWTLRRIARVLRREFGVTYHPQSLSLLLRAHGWSPQRPATRAKERDEALIAAWLHRDWPAVKRGLAAAGASLPSWTRRVTRFGPASAPPGRRAGRRRSSGG